VEISVNIFLLRTVRNVKAQRKDFPRWTLPSLIQEKEEELVLVLSGAKPLLTKLDNSTLVRWDLTGKKTV
jgi:hypothetical protein